MINEYITVWGLEERVGNYKVISRKRFVFYLDYSDYCSHLVLFSRFEQCKLPFFRTSELHKNSNGAELINLWG